MNLAEALLVLYHYDPLQMLTPTEEQIESHRRQVARRTVWDTSLEQLWKFMNNSAEHGPDAGRINYQLIVELMSRAGSDYDPEANVELIALKAALDGT